MGWVVMSERKLNRVEVLAQVDDGWLSVDNAANMLDLTHRQIFRLLKRYRQDGASAIRHKARGNPRWNIAPGTRQLEPPVWPCNRPDTPCLRGGFLLLRMALSH